MVLAVRFTGPMKWTTAPASGSPASDRTMPVTEPVGFSAARMPAPVRPVRKTTRMTSQSMTGRDEALAFSIRSGPRGRRRR